MANNIFGEHISSFSGGMNLDVDKTILGANSYRYAENVRAINGDEATSGVLTNIETPRVITNNAAGSGNTIIATTSIRDYGVIFTRSDSPVSTIEKITPPLNVLIQNDLKVTLVKSNGYIGFEFFHPLTNPVGVVVEITYTPESLKSDIDVIEYILNPKVVDGDKFQVTPAGDITEIENVKFLAFSSVGKYSNMRNGVETNSDGVEQVGGGRWLGSIYYYTCSWENYTGVPTSVYPPDYIQTTNRYVNNIYRVEFEDNGEFKSSTPVLGAGVPFNIPDIDLSIVSRYESDQNIKVYWADGVNPIRVVNIMDSYNNIDPESYNIIPASNLNEPVIDSIGTGKLKSGLIQYGYQLYNSTGSETFVSPLSKLISISPSTIGDASINYHGGGLSDIYGEPANKSVAAYIEINDTVDFEYIKVFSIYYYNYGASPIISCIIDTKLSTVDGLFYFSDGGATILSEYTQAEFNIINTSLFVPKKIESKDNMLFAANIKEESWLLDYDSRAYQFKQVSPGLFQTKIDSISGESTLVASHEIATIPTDHDCIHSEIYEKDKYSQLEYKYNTDGDLGGTGPNVSYLFVNTYLIESHGNFYNNPVTEGNSYIDARTARIGDIKRDIENVRLKYSDGSVTNKDLSTFNLKPISGPLDYSNPFISNTFTSYCRDEIYRFGAVYYSDNAKRTDVRWIADVRFPAGYIKNSSWESNIFEMPSASDTYDYNNSYLKEQELLIKPLGISFTFNNIPKSVARIEIVRSPRDINNRTVYTQGVFAKTGTYRAEQMLNNSGDPDKFLNSGKVNTLRPHSIIGMGEEYAIMGPTFGGISWMKDTVGNSPYPSSGATNGRLNKSFGLHGTKMFSYEQYNELTYYSNESDTQKKNRLSFTQCVTSPLFSNRSNFLFINTETAYYGEDYVSQLKNIVSNIKFDIVDVVSPVATPHLIKNPNSQLNYRIPYFGSINNKFMQFSLTGSQGAPTGTVWPSMMYFGADITPQSYAANKAFGTDDLNKYFHLSGLVGASHANIVTPYTTALSDRTLAESNGAFKKDLPIYWIYSVSQDTDLNNKKMAEDAADIYVDTPNLSFIKGFAKRAYISLGGIINHDATTSNDDNMFSFKNGNYETDTLRSMLYDGSSNTATTSDYPLTFVSKANDNRLSTITFKYYNRFSKRTPGMSYGSDYIKVLKRTDNKLSSGVYSTYNSIEDIDIPLEIQDIAYSGDIQPGIEIDKVPNYAYVGQSLYLNWARSLTYGDVMHHTAKRFNNVVAKTKASGLHGECMVVNLKDDSMLPSIVEINEKSKRYSAAHSEQIEISNTYENLEAIGRAALGTYVANIKNMNKYIYGGASMANRQFSEYIGTSSVILRPAGGVNGPTWSSSKDVFGGDTFINLLDYTTVRASDPGIALSERDDINKEGSNSIILSQVKHVGALIPLESSINTKLSSSDGYVSGKYNFAIQKNAGVYGPMITAGGTWNITQPKPEHIYNAAYSSQQNVFGYFSSLLKDKDLYLFDNRIKNSEAKVNDEVFDSWSKFKAANFLDVDTRYGEITKLKLFNNKLLFWQENAFGVLSVNERALISGDNQSALTLGTGGILKQFDYISTSIGFSSDSINSIAESNNYIYWYDKNRAEMFRYNNQVEPISKKANIQSMFNRNKNNISRNVPMTFNKKYNELMSSIYGINEIKSNY